MPGPSSKYAQHRPKVEELLRAGLEPKEIARQLPDIPRATIYRWARKITGPDPDPADDKPKDADGDAIAPDQVVVDGKGQLIPFRPRQPTNDQHPTLADYQQFIERLTAADAASLPDFLLIKRQIRQLLISSENPVIQIQAAHVLARMIQLRAEIPRHILNEESQSDLNKEMADLDGLSDAEIARQYKEMLS